MRFSDDDRGGMEEREGNRGERRAVRAVAARGVAVMAGQGSS